MLIMVRIAQLNLQLSEPSPPMPRLPLELLAAPVLPAAQDRKRGYKYRSIVLKTLSFSQCAKNSLALAFHICTPLYACFSILYPGRTIEAIMLHLRILPTYIYRRCNLLTQTSYHIV